MTTPQTRDIRLIMMVNKFATPLAILLVCLGLGLSQPVGATRYVSLSLLIFSVLFNFIAIPIIKNMGEIKPWLSKSRMGINVMVNIVLVYLLGGHWSPMWLLLALTPIATAIYDNRKKTLLSSFGASIALIVIHALRGLNTPIEWGRQVAYIAFIILLSLMINELAQSAKRGE